MKILIRESQLKRLLERGPNSPAYRGPEGYDDSCDCYIDEELKEVESENKSTKETFENVLDKFLKKKYPFITKIVLKDKTPIPGHIFVKFKSNQEIPSDTKKEIFQFSRSLFRMIGGDSNKLGWDFQTPKSKSEFPDAKFGLDDALGFLTRFF